MSRLTADFAPSPALAEAAEKHAAAERDARRSTVDRERVSRNADALARGDDSVPSEALICAREVEVLAHAGVPVESVARLLDAAAKCGATERETLVEHARRAQRPALGGEPPRRQVAPLPDLDVEDLLADCPVALAQVQATSRLALSVEDLPALVFLGAVSCALAAKVQGLTHNNDGSAYRVWPHLYIGAEAASCANKSLILNRMLRHHLTGPAGVWTKIQGELESLALADQDEREQATHERSRLRKQTTNPQTVERLRELNDRLRKPAIRVPQVAETGAPSPEQHVRFSHMSGFRALVPDEGAGVLNKFLGTKPVDSKVESWIAGFDGDPWEYPSIEGEKRGDQNPQFPLHHLTMVLLFQPGVLSPKMEEESRRLLNAADRGVFPRILCARTRSLSQAKIDDLEARAAVLAKESAESGKRYERIFRALADLRVGDHALQPRHPVVVKFDPDATRVRRAYQVKLKKDIALDGPDRDKPGERSIARLADHAARIAICLAAWRCAEQADAEGRALDLAAARVELADVERAIRVCEGYFRPHVLAVAGRAILDEAGDDAEALREALVRETERARTATIRQRDAQRALGRGWNAGRVKRAADELEARGGLLVERAARGGATFTLAP